MPPVTSAILFELPYSVHDMVMVDVMGSSAFIPALDRERNAHAAADAQAGESLLASRRIISCSSVTRMRQPEAPIG